MPRKYTKKVKESSPTLSNPLQPSEALQPSKTAVIRASLKVLGRTCFAEGKTVQEAIANLKPELARGTGILTLERGGVKKERVVNARIINNLWGKYVSRIHKEIAWKNILLLFSGIF